jgi:hypothetical protein
MPLVAIAMLFSVFVFLTGAVSSAVYTSISYLRLAFHVKRGYPREMAEMTRNARMGLAPWNPTRLIVDVVRFAENTQSDRLRLYADRVRLGIRYVWTSVAATIINVFLLYLVTRSLD